MPVTNNGPKYSMTVVDQAGNQSDVCHIKEGKEGERGEEREREGERKNQKVKPILQSINESVADREREQALREFYEGKIEHITTQAKASDSKAVQLYEQYSSLLKALEDKEAERNELLDKIKAADQETKTSKEDLGIHYFSSLLFSLSSLLYIYYIVFWGGEVSSLVVVGSNPAGVLFFYISFLYLFNWYCVGFV